MSEITTKSKRGRQSVVDVERLQVTLDTKLSGYLDDLTALGRYGRNRNDVAGRIISDFLHENIARLIEDDRLNGVAVEAARARRS